MKLRDQSRARLAQLDAQHLRRSPPTLEGAQGPVMRVEGREIVVLCSNDYLGLAAHPRLRSALANAALEDGVGAGASRLISGSMVAHRAAERALAAYGPLPDAEALLFSSGYSLNVSVLPALASSADVIYSDSLNHASLIDGCRLSRAEVVVVPHGDLRAFERSVAATRPDFKNAFIVTESVFSMDGDQADLPALRSLADRHDAALYVDEAHSIGLLGPQGRGLCARLGLRPDVFVGTLGKALGVSGAYVATDPDTADLLRNRARGYLFSTAPSPALASALQAAVELARDADAERARVLGFAQRLRETLGKLGFVTPAGDGAIVPVIIGDAERSMLVSRALFERGVFVQAIRPPTVPEGTCRLRLVPTAAHEEVHIERALAAFAEVRAECFT